MMIEPSHRGVDDHDEPLDLCCKLKAGFLLQRQRQWWQ